MSVERLLVIGVDCLAPRFVFGPDRFALPHIGRLMNSGCWGFLRSCDPPITVPAWSVMTTGKDPGTLGIYGFRSRGDRSYHSGTVATSLAVKEPRVWDLLSRNGKDVIVVGVPQTYPPSRVNGCMVSGILTPDTDATFTYPDSLGEELLREVGDYIIDVPDFRTGEKADLLSRIYRLMENRFEVTRYLASTKPWDFLMMVEMGVDRLHHGFWKYCDREHPKYVAGNAYEGVFREYYEALDGQIGRLLAVVDDRTAVMVVSDHGAQALCGGFCINEWLIEKGYLKVEGDPSRVSVLDACGIDWSRTRAWATGGYCGRIYVNVLGREPEGIVTLEEYDRFREELVAELESIRFEDGESMGNRAFKPEELYERVKGIAPDLLVYFDDLSWRAVGTIGHDTMYLTENDTGPDDANHAFDGVFVLDDHGDREGVEIKGMRIMDVAPTILSLLGTAIPEDMQGRPLCS